MIGTHIHILDIYGPKKKAAAKRKVIELLLSFEMKFL